MQIALGRLWIREMKTRTTKETTRGIDEVHVVDFLKSGGPLLKTA